MTTIPTNYPHGCKEEQIFEAIKALSEDVVTSGANINKVMQLTPLVQLGVVELQKRLIEKSSRISERLTMIAIGIATVSVLLSLAANYSSYISTVSGEGWKAEQLLTLQQIRDSLANVAPQPPTELQP